MNTAILTTHDEETTLQVHAHGSILNGALVLPKPSQHLIIFVQAHGSCQLNPRNRYLAHILHQQGFATLLLDLLPIEDQCISSRGECLHYDVSTLAMRLTQVTDYLTAADETRHLKISYLGLPDGGEVAMIAATERPETISSTILLGCEMTHLLRVLPHLKMPTLLLLRDEHMQEVAQYQKALVEVNPDHNLPIFHHLGMLFHSSDNLEFIGRSIGNWLS
jgi:putative phosphoribosyl transferase